MCRWGRCRSSCAGVLALAVPALVLCVSCHRDSGSGSAPPPQVTAAATSRDAADLSQTVSNRPPADLAASTTRPENPDAPDAAPAGSSQSNPLGGCAQCHVDCEDELAGTAHLAESVGCVQCHGPSEGHADDENNEVLPDRVFAREDIDAFCRTCHECPRETHNEPAGTDDVKKVCTDCHGAHDLQPKKDS